LDEEGEGEWYEGAEVEAEELMERAYAWSGRVNVGKGSW